MELINAGREKTTPKWLYTTPGVYTVVLNPELFYTQCIIAQNTYARADNLPFHSYMCAACRAPGL